MQRHSRENVVEQTGLAGESQIPNVIPRRDDWIEARRMVRVSNASELAGFSVGADPDSGALVEVDLYVHFIRVDRGGQAGGIATSSSRYHQASLSIEERRARLEAGNNCPGSSRCAARGDCIERPARRMGVLREVWTTGPNDRRLLLACATSRPFQNGGGEHETRSSS